MISFRYRKSSDARLIRFVEPEGRDPDKYREQVRVGKTATDAAWDAIHAEGRACECGRGHTMLSCTAE